MEIKPIAYLMCNLKEKFGIPRQSGRVPSLKGEVVFCEQFNDENAIRGLEEFSHIWLIFDFSLNHRENFSPTVRPPRLGGNKRVGVFATRSPFRPNNLGLSCVKLDKIVKDNNQIKLLVSGIDILDNTPIYDIKPYIPFSDCVIDAKGSFSDENKEHKLKVEYPDTVIGKLPKEFISPITQCIEDDPRPSYQNDERIYTMRYENYDVSFVVNDLTATIIDVIRIDNI